MVLHGFSRPFFSAKICISTMIVRSAGKCSHPARASEHLFHMYTLTLLTPIHPGRTRSTTQFSNPHQDNLWLVSALLWISADSPSLKLTERINQSLRRGSFGTSQTRQQFALFHRNTIGCTWVQQQSSTYPSALIALHTKIQEVIWMPLLGNLLNNEILTRRHAGTS